MTDDTYDDAKAERWPAPPTERGERETRGKADSAWTHFNDRVRDRIEGEYGEFTDADWQAAVAMDAEIKALRARLHSPEERRSGEDRREEYMPPIVGGKAYTRRSGNDRRLRTHSPEGPRTASSAEGGDGLITQPTAHSNTVGGASRFPAVEALREAITRVERVHEYLKGGTGQVFTRAAARVEAAFALECLRALFISQPFDGEEDDGS